MELLAHKLVEHALDLIFGKIVLCGDEAEVFLLVVLDLLLQGPVHEAGLVAVDCELLEVRSTALLIELHLGHLGVRHGVAMTFYIPLLRRICLNILGHYGLQFGSFRF